MKPHGRTEGYVSHKDGTTILNSGYQARTNNLSLSTANSKKSNGIVGRYHVDPTYTSTSNLKTSNYYPTTTGGTSHAPVSPMNNGPRTIVYDGPLNHRETSYRSGSPGKYDGLITGVRKRESFTESQIVPPRVSHGSQDEHIYSNTHYPTGNGTPTYDYGFREPMTSPTREPMTSPTREPMTSPTREPMTRSYFTTADTHSRGTSQTILSKGIRDQGPMTTNIYTEPLRVYKKEPHYVEISESGNEVSNFESTICS
jgi:hypothetical protein